MKTKLMALVGFVVLTFGAPRSWAQTGVDNPAVFELDGNTQVNATVDWESTFSPTIPQTLQPIQDPAPLTIFTTGGSKDTNDVSQWKWKNGSVPDKDNITQAAAVALALPNGNTAVYFTAARFDNSGDADIGLWFFQQNVAPQPNGTFGGPNHVDGDLLLLVNFTGGGLVPSIQAFVWLGGVNGGPVLAGNLTTGECGAAPNAGNYDACAITNTTASNAPPFWNYTPKGAPAGIFPPQTFFEGGVNLNKIFTNGVPCFSSFLAETRSSSSITAQLKDFAEGAFNLCGIKVTKICDFVGVTPDGTQLQYTFHGTVTNTGAGTVYDVQVVDTPLNVTGTQTPANPIPVNPSTLTSGQSGTWGPVTFTTNALTFTDQAVATAASAPGGAQTVTDTTTASCIGEAHSSITITKDCIPGASLLDIGNNVVVQVGVSGTVTNTGQASLTNIILADNPAATITFDGLTPLAPGQSRNWSATYQPADVPGDGTCNFADTIRVTAATPAIGDPVPFAVGCPDPNDLACHGAACRLCPSTP